MQGILGNVLQTELLDPGKGLGPLKTRAVSGVNSSTDALKTRMEESLASRGMERSGQTVTNMRAIETARMGQIADTEAQFAGMEIDQKNRLLQMLAQFGFASPGNTSTGPSNMLGGAISGGLETATLLMALSKMGGFPGMGNT